jgi:hypothetical protein
MRVRKAFTVLLMVAGCGGDDIQTQPPVPVRTLPEPALRMVAPTAIRVGEDLTIFGKGFADKGVGETRLMFEGIYQTTGGKLQQVKLEAVPTYQNQGVMSWNFGPNIPFSSEEDTGSFRGVLRATNVGLDGTVKEAPQPIGVEIQVLPSILLRQMRPVGAGCSVGITDTTEESKFLVEVKTIGLKAGSQIAPLRFVYTFMKEHFSFAGTLSSAIVLDPEALFPKKGPVSVIDDVTSGTSSSLGSAPRNVIVAKGAFTSSMASLPGSIDNLFGLTQLTTATIPEAANSVDATMNIVAIDSTGQAATRAIPLRIWTAIEVAYSGDFRTARSFDPVPVSGCIPGGDIGRDVTYSESTSETRTRTFTVTGKVSGGVDIKVVRLNAEFGMDVQAQVTSSSSKDLQITGKILPKEFAVFYRQTLQIERRAKLISHGACGNVQSLGEVVVTDWIWSPDLAKGSACPPLPPSNLPAGKVF